MSILQPRDAERLDHTGANAGCHLSISLLVTQLVGEASSAFDFDRELARTSLRRAAELLRVDTGIAAMPVPVKGGLTPWQINRVVAEIENRIASTITLRYLADISRLSSNYFSRAFKASMGRSPHSYIIERRVAKAKLLMESTSTPLSQISISCGFADQAHFSRIFSRIVGSSPNRWRRQNDCSKE